MINNFIYIWLVFISSILFKNVIFRLYKYYKFNYLFSINIDTFIDLNGINLITWITFKNIYVSSLMNWKSKENMINLIKAFIYIINRDTLYYNKNLCIVIAEVNLLHNGRLLPKPIAQPLFIKFNDINSACGLFYLIKWNSCAFNNDLTDLNNNIVFMVKIL
jgi:hypothetical protein